MTALEIGTKKIAACLIEYDFIMNDNIIADNLIDNHNINGCEGYLDKHNSGIY